MGLLKLFHSDKQDNYLSVLKNPFERNKVTRISIYTWNINGEYKFSEPGWVAEVDFQNGMTRGSQKFETKGAENLGIIIKQVEDFLLHLK